MKSMNLKNLCVITHISDFGRIGKKICTYRGYELIRGIDCWGNISYAPYKNGSQYGDVLDGYDDESAVAAFIKAIDDDPGDPDFML